MVEPDPSQYEERRYPSQQQPGSTFRYWARRQHFDGGGAAPVGLSTGPAPPRSLVVLVSMRARVVLLVLLVLLTD